jgi:hypothetical protein
VAKFSNYKHREMVRKAAFAELKGTHFYVNEQFPKEIEDKRKLLYPVRRTAHRAGDKVRLAVDKLYINDRVYEPGKAITNSKSDILRRTHTIDEMKPATRAPTLANNMETA